MSDTSTDDGPRILDSIEKRSIESLKPYTNNAKKHPDSQVETIAHSIAQYGFDQPIVVDAEGEIIKGHGRLAAAKRLGLTHVPVIEQSELSHDEARAARIADNKTNESGWHEDILLGELEDLDGQFDAMDLGFEKEKYDDLLDGWGDDGDLMDAGVAAFNEPGGDDDTRLSFDFATEMDRKAVEDYLGDVMRARAVGSREEALVWLADNADAEGKTEWDREKSGRTNTLADLDTSSLDDDTLAEFEEFVDAERERELESESRP